jgi:hypothetical protein
VSKIKESKEDSPLVRRVEVFADKKEDKYGILRTLFVAYSSETSLLRIAAASDGVIQVRSVSNSGFLGGSSSPRGGAAILEDKLLLKRSHEDQEKKEVDSERSTRPTFFSIKAPDLIVSPRWREKMNLEPGDRLLVSNPIENYEVPPPNV